MTAKPPQFQYDDLPSDYANRFIDVMDGRLLFDSICVTSSDQKEKLSRQGFGSTLIKVENDEEALVLMDEEALFMLRKNLLSVRAPSDEEVTAESLWKVFCAKRTNFPSKFKVYCHLKEQGFTVKSGTNFGMDYAAYRLTPALTHSEFCVRVISDAENKRDMTIDWRTVSTMTRVMPDVMKLCILCFVLFDEQQGDSSPEPIENPSYLNLFDVAPRSISLDNMNCLDRMQLRFLSSIVRRLPVNSATFQSIDMIQQSYRNSMKSVKPKAKKVSSINYSQARKDLLSSKRQRRDHTEIRAKSQSQKSSSIWETLGLE